MGCGSCCHSPGVAPFLAQLRPGAPFHVPHQRQKMAVGFHQHAPILILAARILHHVYWHPLLKFVILTAMGAVASFALSAAVFRRIPFLCSII